LRVFIGLAIMGYGLLYRAPQICKGTGDFFFGRFYLNLSLVFILGSVFYEAIAPLALVGYEMIIANSALRVSLANYHLISNARSWNNC